MEFKSHSSQKQKKSRKFLAPGSSHQLPQVNSPSLSPDSLRTASCPSHLTFSLFFHLPSTVALSFAHLCIFHFISASAWFLLSGPLTYNYFCVFVSMVSLAFVNPPFFLRQPLVSVYLNITLPDFLYQNHRQGILRKLFTTFL